MENTLALMNSKNEGYRKSLTKVDQSCTTMMMMMLAACTAMNYVWNCITFTGEEVGQLETLEGQWRAALDKHKHRKRHAKQLEEDLQVYRVH